MLRSAEILLRQIKQAAELYDQSTGCCSSLFSTNPLASRMSQILVLADAVLNQVDHYNNLVQIQGAESSTSPTVLHESALTNLKAIKKMLDPGFYQKLDNARIKGKFEQMDLQIDAHINELTHQLTNHAVQANQTLHIG